MIFTKFKWLWLLLLTAGLMAGCIREITKTEGESKKDEAITKRDTQPKRSTLLPYNYGHLRACCMDIVKDPPHPMVTEINYGNMGSQINKFWIFIDTANYKLTLEEAFKLTKEVLKFKEYEDIKPAGPVFRGNKWVERNNSGIITVDDFDLNESWVSFDKNIITGRYIANAIYKRKNYISLDSAIQIVKTKTPKENATHFCWDRLPFEDCYPRIKKEIHLEKGQYSKENNIYNATYFFCSEKKYCTTGYRVNALTGEFTIREQLHQGAFSSPPPDCKYCTAGSVITNDAGCSNRPINVNFLPDNTFASVNFELNNMFPTYYDNCQPFPSIEIAEYTPTTPPLTYAGNNFILYDVNYYDFNVQAFTGCIFVGGICANVSPFVSEANNTSFNREEMCAWNAINALSKIQIFWSDYFIDRNIFANNSAYFNAIIPLELFIGYGQNANAYYTSAMPHIYLGTGRTDVTDNNPFTNAEIISHEYVHHLLFKYFDVTCPSNLNNESCALHEALSDIYSTYYLYKGLNETEDWSFGETVVNPTYTNSQLPRLLNNPTNSAKAQADKYDIVNWDEYSFVNMHPDITIVGEVPYYKAGVISYWFYLLAKGAPTPVNNVALNAQLVGIDAAEKILFGSLGLLKEKINTISDFDDGVINFFEFRDVVLEFTSQYNTPNANQFCSIEYSRVFRAFEAVGLIDNSAGSDMRLKVSPPCNVLSFEDVYDIECPTGLNFAPVPFGNTWAVQTTLGNSSASTSGPFYIEVFSDDNNDCIFDDSELHPYLSAEVASLSGLALNIIDIPTRDTKIKIIITDVSNLPAGTSSSSEYSLPSTQIIFTINEGCNVTTPEFSDCVLISDTPTTNEGVVNITTSGDVIACVGQEICIDYDAAGPTYLFINANSSGLNFNNNETLPQSCIDGNCLTQGQLCLTPTVEDAGTYTVNITASDNHPTQAISNSSVVTVSIVDPATDVWAGTSPVATTTNASSATANDGSITVNLGSNFGLKYLWYKTPVLSSIATTTTGTLNNLSAGLYKVDVYIDGTNCLYNSYTARVRVNLNTPVCYIDNNTVSTRVAPRIFSDAVTINIALDTEDGFNAQLKVYNMQGIPVANLIEGGDNLLQGGTHTFTFDGSSLPNGLYAINLKLIVPSCLRRVGYDETIRIFKFDR